MNSLKRTGLAILLLAFAAPLLFAASAENWGRNFGAGDGVPCKTTATGLQYNNNGRFGCVSGATSDGTNATFGSGVLRATSPRITTDIKDANGNVMLTFSATASAVDGITVTNAATGNPANVSVSATGSDSNINLALKAKGTGNVCIGGDCSGTGLTIDKSALTTSRTLTVPDANTVLPQAEAGATHN